MMHGLSVVERSGYSWIRSGSQPNSLKIFHRFRRLGRRVKRSGYILLIGGFVIDLLLLVMSGRFTTAPFAFGLLLFLGVTYPVSLIVEIYGRAFEGAAVPAK